MQLFHPAKRRNCVSNRGINWKDNAGLRECYSSSFSVRFAVLMRIYPNTAKKSFGNSNQIPFKPAPPLSSSALFQRTALDSFMGWADKAITKHVTRLVGATLHKCEDAEKKTGDAGASSSNLYPKIRSALQEPLLQRFHQLRLRVESD